MRNKKFSYIKRLLPCILAALMLFGSVSASAESQVPYDTYTYWTDMSGEGSRKSVYTQPTYEVDSVLDNIALGVEPFSELSDFCIGDDGSIYMLDSGAEKITVLSSDFKVKNELKALVYNGEELDFAGAKGIYEKQERLYICDTQNGRVIVSDLNGNVSRLIEKPTSVLIPEDFQYRPIKITADSRGFIYILSEGSFYGALLFSPEDEFMGFFGSNSVTTSVASVLKNITSRIFTNNVKKSASARALPYSIVDLCMSGDDFIYTVTGATSASSKGQIRKLFVGNGSDILGAGSENFVDEGNNTTSRGTGTQIQDLCCVDIDSNGFIYSLDSKFGRIFVYDKTGRMLSAFGGGFEYGEQQGNFRRAAALALSGDKLLVLDSLKNTVTVFKPTEFFKLIAEGQSLTLSGDYTAAEELWKKVLSYDSSCQLAYSGLARAEYAAGNYELAKEYAEKGYDRDTYALAFKEIRTEFITDYFWIVAVILIIAVVAIAVLLKIKHKKNIKLIKNRKLQLAMSVFIHPIDSFTVIKEKRLSSIGISAVLLIAFYITSVLSVLAGGFMFTYYDAASFNSLFVLIKSAGLIVLWIVANWLVCSLMGGNGRISEIITVACYSLIPLILNQLLQIALTNALLPDEATFLGIINAVAYLLFFLMLAFGSMVIHDYGFGKFIGTSVVTVLGMAVVVFLIFLIVMLFQQLAGFISTLFIELTTF